MYPVAQAMTMTPRRAELPMGTGNPRSGQNHCPAMPSGSMFCRINMPAARASAVPRFSATQATQAYRCGLLASLLVCSQSGCCMKLLDFLRSELAVLAGLEAA